MLARAAVRSLIAGSCPCCLPHSKDNTKERSMEELV